MADSFSLGTAKMNFIQPMTVNRSNTKEIDDVHWQFRSNVLGKRVYLDFRAYTPQGPFEISYEFGISVPWSVIYADNDNLKQLKIKHKTNEAGVIQEVTITMNDQGEYNSIKNNLKLAHDKKLIKSPVSYEYYVGPF